MRTARLATLTIGALAGLLCPGLTAQAQTSLEYAVKAAYLTKFLPFITWPEQSLGSSGTPFNLCLLGTDPFGGRLQQAASGQRVGDHPILVRQISTPDMTCQVAFLSLPDPAATSSALAAMAGKPIMTVTDSGANQRGIISFVITDRTVRFDIDNAAASASGLVVSSKLLDLARNMRQRSAP